MCKCCEDGAFTTLIESKKLDDHLVGEHGWCKGLLAYELDYGDYSVVFEMRNGHGYIRLGDRSDMNCLDTDKKFEIMNCLCCGRKLGE